MSKRVLRVVSILFLSSIFVLSCSNKDKTGDGTQTVQGIAKYAGTWTAKFNDTASYNVIIDNNGKVTIDDDSATKKEAADITESGNTYTMKVQHGSTTDLVQVKITFTDANNGTIQDEQYTTGVIKKQSGGNKGLWYYAGTWNYQETHPGSKKGTLIINDNGSVTFEMQQPQYTSKNVQNKGKETYDVIFSSADGTLTLTLKFSNDNDTTGSYEAKYSGTTTANTGTLTKQKQQ